MYCQFGFGFWLCGSGIGYFWYLLVCDFGDFVFVLGLRCLGDIRQVLVEFGVSGDFPWLGCLWCFVVLQFGLLFVGSGLGFVGFGVL